MPAGMDTMHFIKHTALPHDRKPTYICIGIAEKPHKTEKECVCFTVGGNLINYPSSLSTPTADLTTAKILFNNVVSTPNATFMTTDIKDFYLNTPMSRYEYMRIPVAIIPELIMQHYDLQKLVHNGSVIVEI
jgi:hypothetical protein